MGRLGFGKAVLKPLISSIVVFVVIFLFFPSFGQEYLGVGYKSSKINTSSEVTNAADEVLKKTGTKVDDLIDAANSNAIQGLIDSGVDQGKQAIDSVTNTVKDNL